jgi:hypothetical protein
MAHIDLGKKLAMSQAAAQESFVNVMRAIATPAESGDLALTVSLRDLHLRNDGEVRIPIVAEVAYHAETSGFDIGIRARSDDAFFPRFEGRIGLVPDGPHHCELILVGSYEPPAGGLGHVVDRSLLRNAANASLESFLSRIADNVTADARERYGFRHL